MASRMAGGSVGSDALMVARRYSMAAGTSVEISRRIRMPYEWPMSYGLPYSCRGARGVAWGGGERTQRGQARVLPGSEIQAAPAERGAGRVASQ
jgi:hypothetical protein